MDPVAAPNRPGNAVSPRCPATKHGRRVMRPPAAVSLSADRPIFGEFSRVHFYWVCFDWSFACPAQEELLGIVIAVEVTEKIQFRQRGTCLDCTVWNFKYMCLCGLLEARGVPFSRAKNWRNQIGILQLCNFQRRHCSRQTHRGVDAAAVPFFQRRCAPESCPQQHSGSSTSPCRAILASAPGLLRWPRRVLLRNRPSHKLLRESHLCTGQMRPTHS